MKIGSVRLSGISLAVLGIQLALVLSIAVTYLRERASYPRVWTRAAAYDPDLFMRGRYLALRPIVDACRSGVQFNGTQTQFVGMNPVRLAVENNKLVAYSEAGRPYSPDSEYFVRPAGASCDAMALSRPVDFYISEHAQSPLPLKPGDELWIEVTVPPKGSPRPLQLALKHSGGAWQPLTYR